MAVHPRPSRLGRRLARARRVLDQLGIAVAVTAGSVERERQDVTLRLDEDHGSNESTTHEDVVETVPFGGGRPTRIASGDSAAWIG